MVNSMVNFVEWIRQLVDKFIYWDKFPLFIYIIIFIIFIRILKGIFECIRSILKICCNGIQQAKKRKFFEENSINLDINESYEKAPLTKKRNFLWGNKLFGKNVVEECTLYLHIYILLLKSSLIFLLNPKHVSNFLKGSVVIMNPTECTCGDINITLSSFIIIPDKLTYAEFQLKNLSSKEIQFKVAKDKAKDFIKLKLYDSDGINFQKISLESNNNSIDVIQNGNLQPCSKMNLTVIFKTIDQHNIHDAKKAEISGYLRFQGKRDYIDFLLPLNGLNSSKETVYQHISNMFTESELFSVFKCGGITFVAMSIIILLFLLSIAIRTLWLCIFFFIVALVVFVISIPINVVIIQYIYDFNQHRSE